jgi:hypothetical protein
MLKKLIMGVLFFNLAWANEYLLPSTTNFIHTVTILTESCGVVQISTKVGHLNPHGCCQYERKTKPHEFDPCGPAYLDGNRLTELVGPGFNCAATHLDVWGRDSYVYEDTYELKSDENGNYIGTSPESGVIDLRNGHETSKSQ